MKDSFGREIDYLRISVTKRCNLNCSYCGREKYLPENEMSAVEITEIVKAFAKNGIKKVRLTGGEPLMREDITKIAKEIKNTEGIESLYITTNGILLAKKAEELRKAGVDGVNISLDTLNPLRYKQLTGTDKLNDVLEGIGKVLETDFSTVKINSVLVRGKNDDEAGNLLFLAKDKKLDVRFIELMPFSKQGENRDLVVTTGELLGRFPFLCKEDKTNTGAAEYFTAEGFCGRVGFISPRSNKFCAYCNRVRLLADGKIKLCLGSDKVYDIRQYIGNEDLLSEKIQEIIKEKPVSHHFEEGEHFRGLNLIGG